MSACTGDGRGNASDPDQSVALPTSQIQLASALTPFESCEPFLRHIKDNALNMVSAWGVAGSYFPAVMEGEMLRDAVPETMALDSKSSSQTQYSTTNIQEAGVDEPDIIKTDGQRIVALLENRLHVLKANSGELRQSGELRFPNFWAQDMFLLGDRVVVFGQMAETTTPLLRSQKLAPSWRSPITTLISVDIGKAVPQITSRLHIDGRYISSRLVGNLSLIHI